MEMSVYPQLYGVPSGAHPDARSGGRISELDDIDTLFRIYQPRLLRFVAFSIGDLDVAESITQDCFLKAYAARDRFRGECSAFTWLTRIAVNLIKDQQRTAKFRFWRLAGKRSVDVAEMASLLSSGEASPEIQLLARERARQVGDVIEKLSPNQRRVFLLRFVEEMSLDEVCMATGMTLATVKTHTHRALKAIRTEMGKAR